MIPFPGRISQLPVAAGFHQGKGSLLSLLGQTAILGMDLMFLYVILQPKLPSVYLQNLIQYHSISTELHLTVKEVQPCIHNPGVHWSGDVPIIQKQLT